MNGAIESEQGQGCLTCVIFELNNSLYAVDAMVVRQILCLPALTYIKGMPSSVLGVFDLGGRIVPVVNLDLRFGHMPQPCTITDNVLVVEAAGRVFGFIANHTLDVRQVSTMDLSTGPQEEGESHETDMVLQCRVEGEGDIIMLLNHDRILPPLQGVGLQDEYHEDELTEQPCFYTKLSPEEMAILQQRAQALRRLGEEEEVTGRQAFAVLELSGELFAVELMAVREFARIGDVTPIPCCPPYISGNMNLRGDIVTLVDIRAALSMSLPCLHEARKIVVAKRDGLLVGVVVREVVDLVFAAATEFRKVPTAVKERGNGFVKGEISYDGRMVTVLDLSVLLANDDMLVDEKVM